jgi:hypothetical protein
MLIQEHKKRRLLWKLEFNQFTLMQQNQLRDFIQKKVAKLENFMMR